MQKLSIDSKGLLGGPAVCSAVGGFIHVYRAELEQSRLVLNPARNKSLPEARLRSRHYSYLQLPLNNAPQFYCSS